jgi:hypothetical protein
MPHADTVVYCNDAQKVYFFAVEGTQMLRNINDSGYISFTIDDYTVDWRKVRELQGVGRCRAATTDDDLAAWSSYLAKFGHGSERPVGLLHGIVPNEMHFVDFDYTTVAGQTGPDVRSRIYQIEDSPPPPTQGPVATSLDRFTYEPGQIIFRPGDPGEHYYVVVDGEVEIRGEGYGADQTVVRLGPGQFFGDRGTLRGQRGALTCHAVTPVVLLAVDRNSMRDLLRPGADED